MVDTVKKSGCDVDNVVRLGLELYFYVVERLLKDLGLSGCSILRMLFLLRMVVCRVLMLILVGR